MLAVPIQCQTFLTPIQHVIIIVQENRTPDNLFQDPTLITNGADIAKAIDPHAVPLGVCWDIGHSNSSWWGDEKAQHTGSFCPGNSYVPANCKGPSFCLNDTHVENTSQDKTIQPYWDIAETYGFANYFFQTNQGPSFPAHQFLFGGTSSTASYPVTGQVQGTSFPAYRLFNADLTSPLSTYDYGCTAPTGFPTADIDPTGTEGNFFEPTDIYPPLLPYGYPCYEHWTLADQLDSAGLHWRYYGYANSSLNTGDLWNTPNAIEHICQGLPGGQCDKATFLL